MVNTIAKPLMIYIVYVLQWNQLGEGIKKEQPKEICRREISSLANAPIGGEGH